MDLERYVDDLRHRLTTAADAAGDDARLLAERLTSPLDAAVRLVLLDALSTAAGEISAELAPGSVDVRLRGGEPEFVVDAAVSHPASPVAEEPAEPSRAAPGDVEGGATTRTTLRLPDHLKTQVEAAAARDGISVNTWLVRAVASALERPGNAATPPPRAVRWSRNRQTGWVR